MAIYTAFDIYSADFRSDTIMELDLKNKRVLRSRYRQALQKKWIPIVAGLVVALFTLGGTALIAIGLAIGWVVLLPAVWVITGWLWYTGDLAQIPLGKGDALHDILEPELLANLRGENQSAFDIWKALENTNERWFLQNRYGIDGEFFEHMVSQEPGSSRAVWEAATKLQQFYQTHGMTNMVVLVAIVTSVPGVEEMLRSSSLELGDVLSSVPWMNDIKEKQRLVREKKNFGGIGRDWAYGYTPILRQLGHNVSESIQRYGFFSDTRMHEQIVNQMAQAMGSGNNVITLVGEEGVGKTTSVYAFAERLLADTTLPKQIRYSQVVELDASTLIANARGQGELESLMLNIFNEAYHAKNIILFFDEAHVFFGSGTGNVDLSHVLQPIFENGSVRIVLAMNPQQWQRLASSGAAARLTPVTVPAADEANTLAVLRDQVMSLEHKHRIIYTYQALQEAYKLGGRYVTTQAMPGAALNVLQQAATTTQQQLITRTVVQNAVEQTYGIKLQTADAGESSNLLNLENDLRAQVISQDRAITVIANALRRSRSGVGNPDRPIGTFLFLGPTGVGKTELSKALARSYFGDESAIIRVDMNQFVSSDDVARLITPMNGTELGFLGQVRQKPFSVILLDEIEKANSAVINTLLQMLDEGVMRDSDNKAVSFRDAIIIATSNAGADDIRTAIDEGKDVAELESTFVDSLIARGSFAPEFVNRFDEVVLFKPLSQDDLVQVIDLIVAGINKTLDAQKVQVTLTPEAKRWLVAKGYDAKLGARPMRRMAQRYVENIVAKRLLEKSVQSGGAVQLDVSDFESAQ